MSEELKRIFADNLRRILKAKGKTQAELAKHMGVSTATTSDWVNGKKMPRSDKLQSIANWLMVELSDLLNDGEENEEDSGYYLNPETAAMAQEIFENKELRTLFSVQRDMDPEDLKALHNMALALKRKEKHEDDDQT